MSDDTTTTEQAPDLLDDGRAAALEDGFLTGKPAEETPNDEELFGRDPTEGWNVDRQPKAEPEAKAPTEEEDEAVAARLSVDRKAIGDMIDANPGLTDQLEAAGIVKRNPRTEAELSANLQALQRVHDQMGASQATHAEAVSQAVEAYEEGLYEPSEIADALLHGYGPHAVNAFLSHWHSDDIEYGDEYDEEDAPDTAEEYAEQRLSAWQEAAEKQEAEAEAKRQHELAEAVAKEASEFERRHPDASHRQDLIARIVQAAHPQGVESAEEARLAFELGYRGAREVERAEHKAAILADFDQEIHRQRAFEGGSTDFDHSAAVERNLGRTFDPQNVPLPPSREEISAQLDDDLFGDERRRAEGWGAMDKIDVNARKAEQASHRKGLT